MDNSCSGCDFSLARLKQYSVTMYWENPSKNKFHQNSHGHCRRNYFDAFLFIFWLFVCSHSSRYFDTQWFWGRLIHVRFPTRWHRLSVWVFEDAYLRFVCICTLNKIDYPAWWKLWISCVLNLEFDFEWALLKCCLHAPIYVIVIKGGCVMYYQTFYGATIKTE